MYSILFLCVVSIPMYSLYRLFTSWTSPSPETFKRIPGTVSPGCLAGLAEKVRPVNHGKIQ